ncbi:MAG: hypothetical protein EBY21_14795, partial [Alphaproteobacteria bacterium]|nr:hypothetical protein [Alphaproteobacteria bacterium]
MPALAEARAGLGGSSGSRGSRTNAAPAPTTTAPSAAPMQRSATPQTQPGVSQTPNAAPAAAPAANPGFFGSGFGRGLMGGLLGAGLFGLLFGSGMFGGLGGIMSILGLFLQIALLIFLVKMAMAWYARRQMAPAAAFNGPQGSAYEANPPQGPSSASGYGASPVGASPVGVTRPMPTQALNLAKEDFDSFERLLSEVQHAYADENIEKLRKLASVEMVSYFAQDIAEMIQKGQANRVSGVHLLQGDLSEAWSEAGADYATSESPSGSTWSLSLGLDLRVGDH